MVRKSRRYYKYLANKAKRQGDDYRARVYMRMADRLLKDKTKQSKVAV